MAVKDARKIRRLFKQIGAQVQSDVVSVATREAQAYIEELTEKLGGAPGTSSTSVGGAHWEPLGDTQLAKAPKFWFESGASKDDLVLAVRREGSRVKVVAGIKSSNEVIWNEFGFTPKNGDKLIRRPLFMPLAQEHLDGMHSRIMKTLAAKKYKIRLNIR